MKCWVLKMIKMLIIILLLNLKISQIQYKRGLIWKKTYIKFQIELKKKNVFIDIIVFMVKKVVIVIFLSKI